MDKEYKDMASRVAEQLAKKMVREEDERMRSVERNSFSLLASTPSSGGSPDKIGQTAIRR